MAGIIAQLTRSARERGNKVTRVTVQCCVVADHAATCVQKYYGANKCLYTLERFDAHGFNPVVHNKYVAERTRQAERNVKKAEAFIGLIDEVRILLDGMS